MASSAAAYNSIKTALASAKSRISGMSYEPFLQGSYRNSTNVYGDSDVDVVVKLDSVFASDLSALDDYQRGLQASAYPVASYFWPDFYRDVLRTLEEYYGKSNIKPRKKCIQVITGPGRITADVVPAIEFCRYSYFYSAAAESHVEGMRFFDSASNPIENFPKHHTANGESNNLRTNGWYKPTVRIFKNARNRLRDDGIIADGSAPSYCVECLIYNAPDACFGQTFGDTYCAVVNYLWTTPMNRLMSQNGMVPLIGTSLVQWNSDAAVAFLNGLRNLWINWR
jgi:hypothetical protein